MNRFQDKVCVVAGGARGIGAETARRYLAEGGKVIVGDVIDEAGEELANELGPNAAYVHLDVSDPESCSAAIRSAIETFGRLDGLVNSATDGSRCASGFIPRGLEQVRTTTPVPS